MNKLLCFIFLSIPLVVISRKSILNPGSHGFYRFFAWEGILWMFIANAGYWFDDPFSFSQIASWVLLLISLYLLIASVLRFGRHGRAHHSRGDQTLLSFEKTTELVDNGIYRYIRHPMYSSLLFLAWGIFLKQPTAGLFGIALITSLFLLETALVDEKECKAYFGEAYFRYMHKTKRFIPFVI